jgi:hypothetical protein
MWLGLTIQIHRVVGLGMRLFRAHFHSFPTLAAHFVTMLYPGKGTQALFNSGSSAVIFAIFPQLIRLVLHLQSDDCHEALSYHINTQWIQGWIGLSPDP